MINAAMGAIASRNYPDKCKAFYDFKLGIKNQCNPQQQLSTVRAGNVNVVQTPTGDVIAYGPNEAAINIGTGVLIQGSETNQFHESNDFSTWSAQTGGLGVEPTVTPNFAEAPDRSMTATRLQMSLSGGSTSGDYSRLSELIFRTVLGQSYTESFFIKSNDSNEYVLGSLIGSQSGDGIFTAGPEWVRQSATRTSAPSESTTNGIQIRGGSYGHSDTIDVLIWQANFVNNLYPSSSIYATGSAATRIADNSTVVTDDFPTTNVIISGSFTWLGKADMSTGISRILESHIDNDNRFLLFADTVADTLTVRNEVLGVNTDAALTDFILVFGVMYNFSITNDSNGLTLDVNGNSITHIDTKELQFSGLLRLGAGHAGANPVNIKMHSLAGVGI